MPLPRVSHRSSPHVQTKILSTIWKLSLATGSSFWENEAGWDAGAVLNEAGGVLDIADGVSFEGNSVVSSDNG